MAAWQIRVFERDTPTNEVVAWLGDGAPTPSGGGGGHEPIDLPRRGAVSVWRGRSGLLSQSIPIVIGSVTGGVSVMPMLHRLINMYRPDSPTDEPPIVKVYAEGDTVLFQHLDYTLANFELGDAVANDAQIRVQQAVTLELQEHRPDERLMPASKTRRAGQSGNRRRRPRTYRVRAGDTLSGIARRLDLDGWRELAKLNRISDPRELRVGQVLRVPQ